MLDNVNFNDFNDILNVDFISQGVKEELIKEIYRINFVNF